MTVDTLLKIDDEQIVLSLVASGSAMTAREIAQDNGRRNGNAVAHQLVRLLEQGRIERVDETRYKLTDAWHLGLVLQSLRIAAAWYENRDSTLAHCLRDDEFALRRAICFDERRDRSRRNGK